ncbi:hypothetical protein HAX54_049620 [Datura stramonium]|uniref:Uncharacterized protein n=1 Tax=Datura stramonium TaxID=4076 RepID=A0ABS8SV92_DATST|nr:hypothetical protein [Datura stramonium]
MEWVWMRFPQADNLRVKNLMAIDTPLIDQSIRHFLTRVFRNERSCDHATVSKEKKMRFQMEEDVPQVDNLRVRRLMNVDAPLIDQITRHSSIRIFKSERS